MKNSSIIAFEQICILLLWRQITTRILIFILCFFIVYKIHKTFASDKPIQQRQQNTFKDSSAVLDHYLKEFKGYQ